MTHDFRGSAASGRLARGGTATILRFPANGRVAQGAPALDADAHRPAVPLSAKDAASQVLASGLFERVAADIANLNKDIAAKPVDPERARRIAEANKAGAASLAEHHAWRRLCWSLHDKLRGKS